MALFRSSVFRVLHAYGKVAEQCQESGDYRKVMSQIMHDYLFRCPNLRAAQLLQVRLPPHRTDHITWQIRLSDVLDNVAYQIIWQMRSPDISHHLTYLDYLTDQVIRRITSSERSDLLKDQITWHIRSSDRWDHLTDPKIIWQIRSSYRSDHLTDQIIWQIRLSDRKHILSSER